MPMPKNKGGLPDLSGNHKSKKKNILPSFDELSETKNDKQDKSDSLPDLTQSTDVPEDNESKTKQPDTEQQSEENADDEAFEKVDNSRQDELTSYDNNNSFEQLSDKEVHDEDAADKVEEETTQDYLGSESDDTSEQDNKPSQSTESEQSSEPSSDRAKLVNKASNVSHDEKPTLQSDDRFEEGTDTQAEDPDEYVDKKKKRIIPFGGKKSKPHKHKHGYAQFDNRHNLQTSVRIVRALSMSAIVLVVGMGIYNTFFKHIPNQDEITSIAQSVNGNIGYPTQRGQAFAEQFAQAYLQAYGDSNSQNSNVTLLNYFYNGSGVNAKDDMSSGGDNSADANGQQIKLTGHIKQNILIQPHAYQSAVLSPKSATFYVSALVSNYNGKDTTGQDGKYSAKWISLAINVLYNPKKDALSIQPDSPSLVPTPNVIGTDNENQNPLIGNGSTIDSKSVTDNINTTITGFLTAYGDITESNHSAINQFINSDAQKSVFQGFGGHYKYVPSSNDSGDMTIYRTDQKDVYKALITATWKGTTDGSSASINYPSKYVITLEKVNNKYFVTNINPFTYIPNNTNNDQ